eukprot:7183499-Prorocentrum_lima.AAC.1
MKGNKGLCMGLSSEGSVAMNFRSFASHWSGVDNFSSHVPTGAKETFLARIELPTPPRASPLRQCR